MATISKPKSILKKPTYPATAKSKEDRDRETALYHANLIQQRKDIELQILLSMETLLEYPLATPPCNAANPSTTDANTFKEFLLPFQPSDYDALIEERNIGEKCGYALCPNPRVRESGGGIYRLLGMGGKAKDFKVVKKEELEKWCSEACARRALYVRVQLSENPAWERGAAEYGLRIDLLDEPKSQEGALVQGIGDLDLQDRMGPENARAAVNLALERGDQGRMAKKGLVDITIQEKATTRLAEAPSLQTEELSGRLDDMHLSLEGHTSTFGEKKVKDEDEMDTDWRL